MAKTEEHGLQVNTQETLLSIYILQILKQHSSPKAKLSAKMVCEYLKDEYSIGNREDNQSQIKKVRRYLDTLHESYRYGCIRKAEGKTRQSGHTWWYDASRDKSADEIVQYQETLTDVEVGLLIDLLLSTKILSSEGTLGIIDKLLKKTSISDKERMEKLVAIQEEEWFKTPNEDLAEKKSFIEEECIGFRDIVFDYENIKSITATPLGWRNDDGICFLEAMVEDKYRVFELDKIRIHYGECAGYSDPDDFRRYDKETYSDKTTLDSLLVNIPTVNKAIEDKKCINFLYRSYEVDGGNVVANDLTKSVLPHSLVFSNGKYYLIGIDEKASENDRVVYFRVDLMYELYFDDTKAKLTNWDNHVYEAIERARIVDNHPLMHVGKDETVIFKVVESALDRVVDAFSVKHERMRVTSELRDVIDSSKEGFHKERIVEVVVRTTTEEAFRWALANADAVELISPPELRYKLRRIAKSIQKTYIKTSADKVQANVDYVLSTGKFRIYPKEDVDISNETFEVLNNDNKNDRVEGIKIVNVNADQTGYAGCFTNARRLEIYGSQSVDPQWAANLEQLVNIHLTRTSIANVSWLEKMKGLKVVRLEYSPIEDLSVLSEHKDILLLELRNLNIRDISYIENYPRLLNLRVVGCPIEDYSPLLRIKPLAYLKVDEKAVEAIGMENLIKHHPDAIIEVNRKIDNQKN